MTTKVRNRIVGKSLEEQYLLERIRFEAKQKKLQEINNKPRRELQEKEAGKNKDLRSYFYEMEIFFEE